jgi:myo-inositol-1-phosphate synthase
MEEKQIKKKQLIRKVLKIIMIVALVSVIPYYYSKNKSVGKELAALVTNYNNACPMMISHDIRMESVNTLPHNTVQYDFTLVRVQKDNIDVEALKKSVEKEILISSKTNPSLEAFRDNGSTVIYNYKDGNEKELFKITLTPEMY